MKKLFLLLALTATIGGNCVGMKKQPTKHPTPQNKPQLPTEEEIVDLFQLPERFIMLYLVLPTLNVKNIATNFDRHRESIEEDGHRKLDSILEQFWSVIAEILLDLQKARGRAKEKLKALLQENNIFVITRMTECLGEFWRIKKPGSCTFHVEKRLEEITTFNKMVDDVLPSNDKLSTKLIQDMLEKNLFMPKEQIQTKDCKSLTENLKDDGTLNQHRLKKRVNKSRVCETCQKTDACKTCSRCRKVYYCCRKCQVADWKEHKEVCKKLNRKK